MFHKASRRGLQALSALLFAVSLTSNYVPATAGVEPYSAAWLTIVASLVALELGALFAAFALWPLVRRLHIVGASCAMALLALCLAVSVPNAMEFAWQKHQQNSSVGVRASLLEERAAGDVNSLRSKLSAYATVRPTKDIERAEYKCDSSKCVRALAAEKVRAGERDALVRNLTDAESKLASTPATAGTTQSFSNFATELHINDWSPATWDLARSLAYVLFLQLSAPLCAVLSGCVGVPHTAVPARVHVASESANTAVLTSVQTQETQAQHTETQLASNIASTPTHAAVQTVLEGVPAHLLRLVHDAGGKVDTSTRKLSDRLGVPHSAVRNGIAVAVSAGVLFAVSHRTGTTLMIPGA